MVNNRQLGRGFATFFLWWGKTGMGRQGMLRRQKRQLLPGQAGQDRRRRHAFLKRKGRQARNRRGGEGRKEGEGGLVKSWQLADRQQQLARHAFPPPASPPLLLLLYLILSSPPLFLPHTTSLLSLYLSISVYDSVEEGRGMLCCGTGRKATSKCVEKCI